MTSKISFSILLLVALPIVFNIYFVLDFWLDSVPLLSDTFAVLFIINAIINAVSSPFSFTVQSSSEIRNYQIIIAVLFLMDLPVAYLLFNQGMSATTVMIVKVCVMTVVLFVRIFFAGKVDETIIFKKVCLELILPMFVTAGLTALFVLFLSRYTDTFFLKVMATCLLELICVIMIWCFCFNKEERASLKAYCKKWNKKLSW